VCDVAAKFHKSQMKEILQGKDLARTFELREEISKTGEKQKRKTLYQCVRVELCLTDQKHDKQWDACLHLYL